MTVVRRALVAFFSAGILLTALAPAEATIMANCQHVVTVRAGDSCMRIYALYVNGKASAYAHATGGQQCSDPLTAGRHICIRK